MKQDMIVILDLGSEENPRLAREIRSLGVYSEIHPHDITLEELKALDFSKDYEKLKGLQIPTFEEVLKQFSGRVIMNIHVKIWDILDSPDYVNKQARHYEDIARLIKKYDCEQHIYFMTTNIESLEKAASSWSSISVLFRLIAALLAAITIRRKTRTSELKASLNFRRRIR